MSSESIHPDTRLAELAYRYLEQTITAEESAELHVLLAGDSRYRRMFVTICLQARLLRESLIGGVIENEQAADGDTGDQEPATTTGMSASRSAHDDAESFSELDTSLVFEALEEEFRVRDKNEAIEKAAQRKAQAERAEHRKLQLMLAGQSEPVQPIKRIVIPKAVFYGSVAAVVALTAMLFWPAEQLKSPIVSPYRPVTPSLPSIVAVLHQSLDAQWEDASGRALVIHRGDNLRAGELFLKRGDAEITFSDGAQVICRAPARFELQSPGAMRLIDGQLAALVPPKAVGFQVATPDSMLIDHGTEFGVEVADGRQTEVHVYTGKVEARFGDQPTSLDLSAGEARRFDASTSRVDVIEVDDQRFARTWEQVVYQPTTTGQARFAMTPPNDLRESVQVDPQHIQVYLERRSVVLDQDIVVTFTRPGNYDAFFRKQDRIFANKKLDSYLIHFEPGGKHGLDYFNRKVRIVFPRPIVGVAGQSSHLTATDLLLGSPSTQYSRDEQRGVAGPLDNAGDQDRITLDWDRRTLEIDLTASSHADEIRVLIESAPETADQEKRNQ